MRPYGGESKDLVTTRRLFWAYCILWLIEGSLRKWVVPQFSMALLLIRDPLVLIIYSYAARARVFPTNGWMGGFWAVSGVLALLSFVHLFSSGMPPDVVLFGFRTFALHLPLIWVVPGIVGRKEIIFLGKCVLYIAPFMAALTVVQFEVGPGHWLNAASLKGGSQIGSAMGKLRPAGTFSFNVGPVEYFCFSSAIIFAASLTKGFAPRWLLAVGVVSTLAALSVSGSRGFFLGVVAVASVGAVAALRSGKSLGSLMGVGLAVLAAMLLLSRFDFVKLGKEIMEDRWNSVGGDERVQTGSQAMMERYAQSFSVFAIIGDVPLLGHGTGSTSNLAQDRTGYSPPVESEWDRVIYEVGPLAGLLYLSFRVGVAFSLLSAGIRALRNGNYVCLLFASAAFFDILNGNVRQVTVCGYVSIACGLCLAAERAFGTAAERAKAEELNEATSGGPLPLQLATPRVRGRGPFAVGGDRARS